MIIQLEKNITTENRTKLDIIIQKLGYKTAPVKTQFQDYLVATGKSDFDIRNIGSLEGIKDIHR